MNKLLIVAALCFVACTPKKQIVTENNDPNRTTSNPVEKSCINGTFRFVSIDVDASATALSNYFPTEYQAFKVNPQELKVFMQQVKSKQVREITVPLDGRCVTFLLRPSNVLSPELAEKYPELQSFQGIGKRNNNETAQIDFDGEQIRVMAQLAEGEFVLDPFKLEQGLVYLSFNAKNSGVPKRPFKKK